MNKRQGPAGHVSFGQLAGAGSAAHRSSQATHSISRSDPIDSQTQHGAARPQVLVTKQEYALEHRYMHAMQSGLLALQVAMLVASLHRLACPTLEL